MQIRILISLMLIMITLGCAYPVSGDGIMVSREAAGVVILNELVEHRPGHRLRPIFVLPGPLPAGEEVCHDGDTGHRLRHSVPYDSWFFFIDDHPSMLFSHPCRYVFVDRGNPRHFEVFSGDGFYPVRRGEMELLDISSYQFVSFEDDGMDKWMLRPSQSKSREDR